MEQRTVKAIVVDDELNARKLLPVLIDWTALGYEFVGEAESGREALDLIETIRPDVVFTDINMPYMDGLELARQVKQRDPLAKIVIMTAYPEFEYAKRSVQIGVQDFLLKPIQAEEVERLALELKRALEREAAHWSEYREMQALLQANAEHLKEKFWNDLLGGAANAERLAGRYEYFVGAEFEAFCSVLVLEAQSTSPDAGEEGRLLFGMRCRRVVEAVLSHREQVDVFHDNGGRVVVLNRNREPDTTEIGEQCIRVIKDKLGGHASVGIGAVCTKLSRVKDSYREALEALRYSKLVGGGQVIVFGDDIRFVDRSWELKLSETEDVLFYIKAGVQDQALQAIERLFRTLSASRGATIEQAQSLSLHFVSLLTYALSELGFSQVRTEWLNGALFQRIFRSGTIGELSELLTDLAKEATDFVHKSRTRKKNRIIDEVKEYIAQEYPNPDVSLASLSGKFHLNASYFSRIFKQETGQSFTDYLLKLRMEAAVKLLNESDWKAYQIAEQVGIKDPYYFSHCFKKVMGVSIQEYKKGSAAT